VLIGEEEKGIRRLAPLGGMVLIDGGAEAGYLILWRGMVTGPLSLNPIARLKIAIKAYAIACFGQPRQISNQENSSTPMNLRNCCVKTAAGRISLFALVAMAMLLAAGTHSAAASIPTPTPASVAIPGVTLAPSAGAARFGDAATTSAAAMRAAAAAARRQRTSHVPDRAWTPDKARQLRESRAQARREAKQSAAAAQSAAVSAADAAQIYSTNLVGNPYAPGTTFTIDVAVRNNTIAPVRSYFVRAYYDANSVSFDKAADVELGGIPPSMGPVAGSGTNTYRNVSNFTGNINNTKYNLILVRLTFTVKSQPALGHGVRVVVAPGQPPLIDAPGNEIPSTFDSSATVRFPPPQKALIEGSMLGTFTPIAEDYARMDPNADGITDIADLVTLSRSSVSRLLMGMR